MNIVNEYEKQMYKHDPENGVYGDCYRTCLATILGIARDKVPHYVSSTDKAVWAIEIQPKYVEWLSDRGLQELDIPVTGLGLEQVLDWQQSRSVFPVPSILTGTSSGGCNHCVVVYDGKIEHDPSLNDSGIIGPCDDGYYWVSWLIPITKMGGA